MKGATTNQETSPNLGASILAYISFGTPIRLTKISQVQNTDALK